MVFDTIGQWYLHAGSDNAGKINFRLIYLNLKLKKVAHSTDLASDGSLNLYAKQSGDVFVETVPLPVIGYD